MSGCLYATQGDNGSMGRVEAGPGKQLVTINTKVFQHVQITCHTNNTKASNL